MAAFTGPENDPAGLARALLAAGHGDEVRLSVAARLARERGCVVLALGGPDDVPAGVAVAGAAGDRGRILAGRTGLEEWAAVLARCSLAVSNDSGGMHLAAAVGTPGVAIFGRTDPDRTGPLGGRCTVVQSPGDRNRDVGRADAEAVRRLDAVRADKVMEACLARLAAPGPGGGA